MSEKHTQEHGEEERRGKEGKAAGGVRDTERGAVN